MATEATGTKQHTFLGHPLGLYVLFFTEMWERFSYYGMRALLMLYMINFFRWSQKDASTVYKVYTSFVYVTPILGGYLADRYLGNRRAVIIGAVLMAVGHFLMAFEQLPIFMGALLFLILGNGFFKPNMSTQVGRYAANDGRRDGAYTIFYMGINLGAFLSPLACGWLQENTVGGFHSGFTLAGIGMVAALAIYLLGQPFIRELPPDAMLTKEPDGGDVEKSLPMAVHEGMPQDAFQQGVPGSASAHGSEFQVNPRPALPAVAAPRDALTEAEAEQAPSILGRLSAGVPGFLYLAGGIVFVGALLLLTAILLGNVPALAETLAPLQAKIGGGDASNISNMVLLAIAGFCLLLLGYVAGQVQGGLRDRVLAILVLGVFVIFFWAAFEQAGNVLSVWADQTTNRYITEEAKPPQVKPSLAEGEAKAGAEDVVHTGFWDHFVNLFPNMVTLKQQPGAAPEKSWREKLAGWFNPMPTAWFQSINALAIFLIAPLFAWLWIFLDRRGWQPSIPLKMALGLFFMSASMTVMLGAAKEENRLTEVSWPHPLPAGITETAQHQLAHDSEGHVQPFHAGRLTLDGQTLRIYGVLDKNECDALIEQTAPARFRKKVDELRKKSLAIDGDQVKSVEVELDAVPAGFDMTYSGLKPAVVEQDKSDKRKLIAHQKLVQKEIKGLLVAAGQPQFRTTIHELYVKSAEFRVSSWWLFWSYILATLGELCLSPVGLSMVSKLAPAKFATMLMGVWMLTSAFGNFAAGAMGEIWGTIPPIDFFLLAAGVVAGAAVVLLVLVRVVTRAMHGVR